MRELRSAVAAAVVFLLAAFAPAVAQSTKPQAWTTNVVPGEFPSREAALAAVRAQGGVYALAERVEDVIQTNVTTFVYGAAPRDADVGPWGKYNLTYADPNLPSEEAAMASALAKLQASSPSCKFDSIAPYNNWTTALTWFNGVSYRETRNYRIHNADPVSCSEYFHVNGSRERLVACPVGFTWSTTENACVKHDIARISTKPQPCSTCENPSPLQHNPVNVSTGDKYQSETDFSLPWLTFSRHYHSAFDVPGGRLGPGWSHDFNIRFYRNGYSNAGVLMPTGEIQPFNYIYGPFEATDGSGRRVRLDQSNNTWRLDDAAQTFRFDSTGKAVKLERLSGDSLSYQYDANGRLFSVVHSSGRSIVFEYDANPIPGNSRLVAVKSNGSVLVIYEYDSAGRLEYARYPNGTARRYHYEDTAHPSHLTGITDEASSRYSTYAYNADGLATLSEHAGGLYRGTFDYQANGSTVYTDANGRVQTFNFSTDGVYRKITAASDADGSQGVTFALASTDFRRRPISRTDKRWGADHL